MKVKALLKAATKSKKIIFGDDYTSSNIILIDGVFTPYRKAREDKRKVDSFFVRTNRTDGFEFNINTVYIKEKTSDAVYNPKKNKKKKKDKGNK